MHHSKSGNRRILSALLFLLLLSPVSGFARKDYVPADRAEAEKWINEATHRYYRIDRVDEQYLLYSSWDRSVHYGIALARVSGIRDAWDPQVGFKILWRDSTHDADDYVALGLKRDAEKFAGALSYLVAEARTVARMQEEQTLQQFALQAKAWRDASPESQMPENAREHQVLAEYAFRNRETENAIKEYKAALDIFPTWPEGQFNLATLAGEQKDYETAVFHMKQYLELVPDSSDAQTAKDSIVVWKDRLNSVFSGDNSQEQSSALSRRRITKTEEQKARQLAQVPRFCNSSLVHQI